MADPKTGRSRDLVPMTVRAAPHQVTGLRGTTCCCTILAYALSWALWLLVILNPTSSPLVPFGPLIAAVVVSLLAGGRKELWALAPTADPLASASDLVRDRAARPLVMAAAAAALAVATGRRCSGVARTQT